MGLICIFKKETNPFCSSGGGESGYADYTDTANHDWMLSVALCYSCSSSCWHTSSCWLGLEWLLLPPSRSLYTLTSGIFVKMLLCWRGLHSAWIHGSMVRMILFFFLYCSDSPPPTHCWKPFTTKLCCKLLLNSVREQKIKVQLNHLAPGLCL